MLFSKFFCRPKGKLQRLIRRLISYGYSVAGKVIFGNFAVIIAVYRHINKPHGLAFAAVWTGKTGYRNAYFRVHYFANACGHFGSRFRGNRSYIIFSYFAGATPENNYTPREPYTVTVTSDAHSYDEQGYARLYIASGGADSPRPIKLRKKADGQWCLWEQYLLTDIRQPKANDPWA